MDELRKAVADDSSSPEDLRTKIQALQAETMKIGQALNKNSAAAGDSSSEGADDKKAEDAEYEEVSGKDKK